MIRGFSFDPLKVRNIGISAHIDSGKTTFTERVLFYSGKIDSIHDVRGTDGVGATMDFMELEKERGITIQSAATTVTWGENMINIIDTPGHVDFTIEVERALRVLDGAVLLLCGAAGVQAQTLTVDKQMKRYNVPRIIFVNKMDRMGAEPWHCIESARGRLALNCAAVQVPIGADDNFRGVVDLVEEKAYVFDDEVGSIYTEVPIPDDLKDFVAEKRAELIECLAECDEELEEMFIEEIQPTPEQIHDSIARSTKSLKFCPVFMGSAYKNKGIQMALNGVIRYLPNPTEQKYEAFKGVPPNEEKIQLTLDSKKPFICLGFKLEEGQYGQLTYCRTYQGRLKRGQTIVNQRTGERHKIQRLGKMHASAMEEISEVEAGDIFVLFGITCASGDTFAAESETDHITMSSMFIPDPVISYKITPKSKKSLDKLNGALHKFRREDPTFHVNMDDESEEIIISGMGELHLEIYAERLKREFDIPVELGEPTVNYRETLSDKIEFNYLHKKQTGGAGQFARVIGYVEPIPEAEGEYMNIFENKLVGTNIPGEYVTAIEKTFHEACEKGPLVNYPVVNIRYVLVDGETHTVDSNSNAFSTATKGSLREAFNSDGGVLLEPFMKVDIAVPMNTYQGVMGEITKRGGNIKNAEPQGDLFVMESFVALSKMFGFASKLRGLTQGQGEFSMEYFNHQPCMMDDQIKIVEKIRKEKKVRF